MKEIEPTNIELLWRGAHPTPHLFGMYEGSPVYLQPFEELAPKWKRLFNFLETDWELSMEKDLFLETIQKERSGNMVLKYEVFSVDSKVFEREKSNHRNFQLHNGLRDDVFYGPYGIPEFQREWWSTSLSYCASHLKPSSTKIKTTRHLGEVTSKELFSTPTKFRRGPLHDPRSEDLKEYQLRWRYGDEVRLDW